MNWENTLRKNDEDELDFLGDRRNLFQTSELQKFLMYRLNRATKMLKFYENEEYKDEGEIIPEYQSKVFEEYINRLKREIKYLKDFIPRYMKLADEIEDLSEYYEDLDDFLQEHGSLIGD